MRKLSLLILAIFLFVLSACAPQQYATVESYAGIQDTAIAEQQNAFTQMTATAAAGVQSEASLQAGAVLQRSLCEDAFSGKLKSAQGVRPQPPFYATCINRTTNVSLPWDLFDCKLDGFALVAPMNPKPTQGIGSSDYDWVPAFQSSKTLSCLSYTVVKTADCPYEGGNTIRLFRLDSTLQFVDIASQTIIAQTTFTGGEPNQAEECPVNAPFGSETTVDKVGTVYTYASPEVQAWIKANQ